MDNPTLKKEIIQSLITAPLVEDLKANRILLITPYGMITGTLVQEEHESSAEAGIVLLDAICQNAADDHYEKYPEADVLPGNDGFILLRDVVLQSGTVTTNIQVLIVFYDQIIAATLQGTAKNQ